MLILNRSGFEEGIDPDRVMAWLREQGVRAEFGHKPKKTKASKVAVPVAVLERASRAQRTRRAIRSFDDPGRVCEVQGCDTGSKYLAQGMCNAHYKRQQYLRLSEGKVTRATTNRELQRWQIGLTCQNEGGCDTGAKYFAKGMCSTHYMRKRTAEKRAAALLLNGPKLTVLGVVKL